MRFNTPFNFFIGLLLLVADVDSFGQRSLGAEFVHKSRREWPIRQGRRRGNSQRHEAHFNNYLQFSKHIRPPSITTALRGGSVVMASAATTPPALAVWIGPALLCALSYALYNIFIKKAATHQMDPILGGVLLQFVAATVGTLLWLVQRATRQTATTGAAAAAVAPSKTAIAWAAAAGLAVGAAELLSFLISGMGVQAMQSIPIVVGGSVLMGTVLGSVWLKEALTWKGWCGVALISIGIALVGVDPGGAGSMH